MSRADTAKREMLFPTEDTANRLTYMLQTVSTCESVCTSSSVANTTHPSQHVHTITLAGVIGLPRSHYPLQPCPGPSHSPPTDLLVRTLLCSSCLVKEARAHSPPYTATVYGDTSWGEGSLHHKMHRAQPGHQLTSGNLQCSKEAWMKSLPAFL